MSEARDDGGPAFPCGEIHDQISPWRHLQAERGMSLRDYFAGQALQGYLASNPKLTLAETAGDPAGLAADVAYRVADAMLARRAKC